MADEHASIAASALVARSQRSDGVSAALADRQRTSKTQAGGIQASRRARSDTYDFDTSSTFTRNKGDRLWLPSPCPQEIASFGLTLGLDDRAFRSVPRLTLALHATPAFRRGEAQFHHPISRKTIELLWITLFPLGCGFQATAMCSKKITRICQCLAELSIEAGVTALPEAALTDPQKLQRPEALGTMVQEILLVHADEMIDLEPRCRCGTSRQALAEGYLLALRPGAIRPLDRSVRPARPSGTVHPRVPERGNSATAAGTADDRYGLQG